MDLTMFSNSSPGELVTIRGSDSVLGSWEHKAFIPEPLSMTMPDLAPPTYLAVADARAALAALDSTGRQLPEPTLLRLPTLRREAQSTSALEGTYAPLAEVFTADDDDPPSAELVEILNYVRMANAGFARIADGWPVSVTMLSELQGILMAGTPLESQSGRIRDGQVVIGRREDAASVRFPVEAARFVPAPGGHQLEAGVRDLVDWMRIDHRGQIDPVVAAGMSHYQFETLHPFRDGNGRVGRFLIVLHLQSTGVLVEPTLTVSPWFEARRGQYDDRLLGVSARDDWDSYLRFFAEGLRQAADTTRHEMVALVAVQTELKDVIRASPLRADSAHALVDLAVANPTFTVRKVEAELGISYGRANKLVGQLVELGILDVVDPDAYKRRFFAPRVLQVLSRTT
ncbi:Fic family protein [Cellulosimicrobium cellulans]|uniref:Fic family protein n=1 Tax=Cellulosimicrobium cellulans TaxID=1710 RepID=UPI002407491F|nr:Fic/DOC family N-terminal domain-containing protein [Cellulosimicrobium cellulans]MDF9876972.1 Fic family protein [Cellulosimicrobium cellulans]